MELPTGSKSFARLNPHLFDVGRPTIRQNRMVERERDLHDQIEALCRARGWLYVHSRMDAPSTIAVGHPDFTMFLPGAMTVFLECKRPGEKATTEQLAKLAHARKLGFTAEIVEDMPATLAIIDHCLKSVPIWREILPPADED